MLRVSTWHLSGLVYVCSHGPPWSPSRRPQLAAGLGRQWLSPRSDGFANGIYGFREFFGGMYLLGDNLALLMVTNYTTSLDTQAIKLGTIKKGLLQ